MLSPGEWMPPKEKPFGLRQFLNLCCHSHVSFGGGNRILVDLAVKYFSGPFGGMVGMRSFPIGFRPIFRGELLVFREGTSP